MPGATRPSEAIRTRLRCLGEGFPDRQQTQQHGVDMLSTWKPIPDFDWYVINSRGHCKNTQRREGQTSEDEYFLPSISKNRYCVIHLSVKNNTFTIPLIYFMPKLFPHIFSGQAVIDTNNGPWSLSEEIKNRRNLRKNKIKHLHKCGICGYFKAKYCFKDNDEICSSCLSKRENMIRAIYYEFENKKVQVPEYFDEFYEDSESEDFLYF
jgi:hypothetical protein